MTERPEPHTPASPRGAVRRAAVVVAASVLLGFLTFHAQGLLPSDASSFANSASGWTLLTAALVYWSRSRPGPAAVLGAVSFVLLVLGYTVAAEAADLYYDPRRFGLVGMVAGPFVGAAAALLRTGGTPAALGTALLAGIGLGEAVYGLTVVGDTTSPVYWVAIGLAGLVLLVVMLLRRLRGGWATTVAVAGTAAVAAAFVVLYQAI